MRLGLVAAVVAALLMVQAPATAHGKHHRSFRYAWSGTSSTLVVQVHRVSPAWHVGAAVRRWNRLPAVRVIRGRCSARPGAYCVHVRGSHAARNGWMGRAYLPRHGRDRARVQLNGYYGRAAWVACHELGHVLGLTHRSTARGCVSQHRVRPSTAERRLVTGRWRAARAEHRREVRAQRRAERRQQRNASQSGVITFG